MHTADDSRNDRNPAADPSDDESYDLTRPFLFGIIYRQHTVNAHDSSLNAFAETQHHIDAADTFGECEHITAVHVDGGNLIALLAEIIGEGVGEYVHVERRAYIEHQIACHLRATSSM